MLSESHRNNGYELDADIARNVHSACRWETEWAKGIHDRSSEGQGKYHACSTSIPRATIPAFRYFAWMLANQLQTKLDGVLKVRVGRRLSSQSSRCADTCRAPNPSCRPYRLFCETGPGQPVYAYVLCVEIVTEVPRLGVCVGALSLRPLQGLSATRGPLVSLTTVSFSSRVVCKTTLSESPLGNLLVSSTSSYSF